MKKLLLSLTAATITATAGAQVYLADTAMTTDRGSGSAKASSLSKPNGNNFGLSFNATTFYSVADDFTVPAGQTWNVDTVIVYGYQTGSSTSSPITSVFLQLRQGTIGGTVVFGDTTTNRLNSAVFTGIYRVDTTTAAGGVTSTTRPIMALKIKVTPTLTLQAGTYWAIYGAKGSSSLTGPWANPKVLPNRTNPSAQNGQQRTNGMWKPAKDSLSPTVQQNLGFPMMIKGPVRTAVANVAGIDVNLQCAPNPVKGSAVFSFDLPASDEISLRILSATGQLVKQLAASSFPAGSQHIPFDAGALPAGQYFCELQTSSGRQTRVFQVSK